MVKKIITTSLFASVLLLSGCGDNEAEARLAAQQALDKGDFASAITSLEAKENRTDEENMLLASSYMGAAGLGFSDTINLMADSTSDNGNTDAFASFADNVKDSKDESTLNNIEKAIAYYAAIASSSPLANQAVSRVASNESNTTDIGDRDLFLGFAYLSKATVVLSYLGDVAKLQGSQEADEDMLASSCAIVHVYSPSSKLPTGCTDVTSVAEGDYKTLNITLDNGNGMTYKRLATANGADMLLTDYKDTSLTPVLVGGKSVTIKDALVDTINDGFDYIEKVAPEDVQKDIKKFKSELGVDGSGKVTSETLSKYIANN